MNAALKLCIAIICAFLLTACFGENYDFSPPTVLVMDPSSLEDEELTETNIDWDSDEHYKKTTDDYVTFANSLEALQYEAEQQLTIEFDSQDFAISELLVSVWKNGEKTELELRDDRSFHLPAEPGEYILEVELVSDTGEAQYVGNILLK
ncbi:hypothetical protein [Sporosarcina sp.]|uniref:hypothetical protein n=1 Tax=Sporosarcina sp. TaxID=49982 RepID=UPI002633798F|nr:hypothetical protein [Sporosarcina sp.]